MSEIGPDTSALLASARRHRSPSAADAARVRQALALSMTAGQAAPRTESASSGGPATAAHAASWAARVLAVGAIATASAGGGYWAGHRAANREARLGTQPSLATRPGAPVALGLDVKPIGPALAKAPAGPSAPRPPAALPREPAHTAHGSVTGVGSSSGDSLSVEVRALRNAERALRDGSPGLALEFLHELDRQLPNGQLLEERDATATLARCARGDRPFGVDLADDFAERHPDSVYRERIEDACATTDSPAPGNSASRRSRP